MNGNMENRSFFYTGTYAPETDKGIFYCELDKATGEMTIVSSTSGIENASFLTLNAEKDRLYAVSEKSAGEIVAFAADPKTGELNKLEAMATEGGDPCYVSLTHDGKYVLAANYSGGNINVIKLGTGGELQEMTAQVKHSGRSIHKERQEGPHPHSIYPDPTGSYVLVCDLGLDEIIVYRLEEGKLVTNQAVKLPPGAGPRHFAFHPSRKWAYGINELNNTITVFVYDDRNGELKMIQNVSTLPEDYVGESYCADIHISPCGRYLYASNRGHDSIALFYINPSTGEIKMVEWVSSGGAFPRNFAVLDGGFVIAANQNSDNLASFRIEPDTGRLIPTGYTLNLPKPVCIYPLF